jgi:hypothetical protein
VPIVLEGLQEGTAEDGFWKKEQKKKKEEKAVNTEGICLCGAWRLPGCPSPLGPGLTSRPCGHHWLPPAPVTDEDTEAHSGWVAAWNSQYRETDWPYTGVQSQMESERAEAGVTSPLALKTPHPYNMLESQSPNQAQSSALGSHQVQSGPQFSLQSHVQPGSLWGAAMPVSLNTSDHGRSSPQGTYAQWERHLSLHH